MVDLISTIENCM